MPAAPFRPHLRPGSRRSRRPARSRGVALLLVLVVLLLVATLATEIALTARTHAKIADHSMNDFLLRSAVDARREIAIAALRYEQPMEDDKKKMVMEDGIWSWKGSRTDATWRDTWGAAGGSDGSSANSGGGGTAADGSAAAAARVYSNRGNNNGQPVRFLTWVEDERGKLNLCGLLAADDGPRSLYGRTRTTLVRLIDRYRESCPELDLSESDAEEMVQALVDWLKDKEDTDANPLAPTNAKRGRLLSIDELLRIPGGKWTPERLYDVVDPRVAREADDDRGGRSRRRTDDTSASGSAEDEYWRTNGVPGLANFLTVWGEGVSTGDPKINVNTARLELLEALLDPGQEELAAKIRDYRREQPSTNDPAPSGSSSTTTETTPRGQGVKALDDMKKNIDGFPDTIPMRLEGFFATTSSTFSIRVIAWMEIRGRETDPSADDTQAQPANDWPFLDFHEVVQRSADGCTSLYAERRSQRPIDWK